MRRRFSYLAAGIIIGIAVVGGSLAIAAGVSAYKAAYKIMLDGEEISLDAYSIEGRTYIQLRELAQAMDFCVWWDEENRIAHIESDKPYDPTYQGPGDDIITIPPQPTQTGR